jgi:hypothetical protein
MLGVSPSEKKFNILRFDACEFVSRANVLPVNLAGVDFMA